MAGSRFRNASRKFNPIRDRTDWTNSSREERLRYILHDHFQGDYKAMGETFPKIGATRLQNIDKQKQLATDEDMQHLASRIKRYNPHWIKSGLGQPVGRSGFSVVQAPEPQTENNEQETLPVKPQTPKEGTAAARVCYLLRQLWRNDMQEMADACNMHPGVIEAIVGGSEPDEDMLLHISDSHERINVEWLFNGAGDPLLPGDDNLEGISAMPTDTNPRLESVETRLSELSKTVAQLASQASDTPLRTKVAQLGNQLNGQAAQLTATFDGKINAFRGELQRLDRRLSEAAPPDLETIAQIRNQIANLDERFGDFRNSVSDELQSVKAQLVDAKTQIGQLRTTVGADLSAKMATLDRAMTELKTMTAAINATLKQASELTKRVDNNEDLTQTLTDLVTETLGEKGTLAGISAMVETLVKSIDHPAIPSDLSDRIEKLEAKLDDLAALPAQVEQLEKFGDQLSDLPAVLAKQLKPLISRIDTIEACLVAVPAQAPTPAAAPAQPAAMAQPPKPAQQPKQPARPLIKEEADLKPDNEITIQAWTSLPGPHIDVLRTGQHNRTMGIRMQRAYEREGIKPNMSDGSPAYPVREMRGYVKWLAGAGQIPHLDEWIAEWRSIREAAKRSAGA